METLNASDAKREFGEMILKVQQAPVGINKNGKPVAVVMSADEYAMLEETKEEWLKAKLQEGINDVKDGRVSDGSEVINRLRERTL